MPPSANPYASPTNDNIDSSRERPSDTVSTKRLCLGWLAVFALNLIVPLFLGWGVTAPEGRIGMLLAVLFILVLGLWICASARQVGFALVVGGVAVALSQVFPILQMMAGIFGFALAQGIGVLARDADGIAADVFHDVDTVAAGFVVTMTTGGLLVAASTVAGLAIRAARSLRRT
jgi:hypothetical protein